MKKVLSVTLLASLLVLLIPGCQGSRNPVEVGAPLRSGTAFTSSTASLLPQGIVLGGFTVSYNGRTVAGGQTTFTYIVTGPRQDFVFRLELPSCAGTLVSFRPSSGDLTDNNTDDPFIPGIEWHLRAGTSTTRDTFSLTYSGLVREGIALTSVRPSHDYLVGQIAGPCARVFDISGSVYNDANTNGIREATEAGIPGVTVSLLDTNGVFLEGLTSDPFGNYKFESVPLGRYTVTLDTNTVAATSTKYVGATTVTFLSVSGGPDAPGKDFGFNPKTSQLITDLKLGLLPTNGLTPGFWKKQLQAAVQGKGNPVVRKDSLLVYISRIRNLLLTEPYQFGTGDGLKAALDSLSLPTNTELGKLKQQLIALEFNWVSRHGIVGTDAPLELVLVGWGESLVSGAQPSGGMATFSVRPQAATIMSTLSTASTVFAGVNKSSGGGGQF
jgi:hypothetical protein